MVTTTASFIVQAIALDGYATTSYDKYWLIAHATVLLIFVSTAFFLTFDHTDIRVHAAQHVKLFCRYCKDMALPDHTYARSHCPLDPTPQEFIFLPRIDTCIAPHTTLMFQITYSISLLLFFTTP